MIVKVLLLKMVFQLSLKFIKLLYFPDVSRQSIICVSTVYCETPPILSSFCKWKAQQILASGLVPDFGLRREAGRRTISFENHFYCATFFCCSILPELLRQHGKGR